MDGKKRRGKIPRFLGLFLLAVVCVGGVELAVCRVMEPELYQQITRPVGQLVQYVQEKVRVLTELGDDDSRADLEIEQPAPVSQEIQEPDEEELCPAQDPAITRFVLRGGVEVLTGGVVELVYFNQGEDPWADAYFGPDPIQGYGCGPTAMAMVVSTLGEEVVDPARMAQLSDEEGYCAPGSGSYLSIVQGMAGEFGLSAVSCGEVTTGELSRLLASGQLLVALMGPGHFTNGGHFIVLRGITLTGKVLVADPNSRERSLALWDPELILDELSSSNSNGAPLWRFSTFGE